MSKSRKDLFEEQLKDLQKDISNLSQKLVNPAIDYRSNNNESFNSNISYNDISRSGNAHVSFTTSVSEPMDSKSQAEKVKVDLHIANKAREDAEYRLSQMKSEVEQLRRVQQEFARLKASYDHLQQDHDSLRISLESSERIRKQQKELINLLQRSHTSGSHNSNGAHSGADSISVISAADSLASSTVPSAAGQFGTHHSTHSGSISRPQQYAPHELHSLASSSRDRFLSLVSNASSTDVPPPPPSAAQYLSNSRLDQRSYSSAPSAKKQAGAKTKKRTKPAAASITPLSSSSSLSKSPHAVGVSSRQSATGTHATVGISPRNIGGSATHTKQQTKQSTRTARQSAVPAKSSATLLAAHPYSTTDSYGDILQRNRSLVPPCTVTGAATNHTHTGGSVSSAGEQGGYQFFAYQPLNNSGSVGIDYSSHSATGTLLFDSASLRSGSSQRSYSFDEPPPRTSGSAAPLPTYNRPYTLNGVVPPDQHGPPGRPPRHPWPGSTPTSRAQHTLNRSTTHHSPYTQPQRSSSSSAPSSPAAGLRGGVHSNSSGRREWTVSSALLSAADSSRAPQHHQISNNSPRRRPVSGGGVGGGGSITDAKRVKKMVTRSRSVPPPMSPNSRRTTARQIQVPIPSPASTFGVANRRL